LKDRPDLDISLLWYWDSFKELNSDRNFEQGEIPWSSIDNFCKRWNINTPDEFDNFVFFIRGMDKVYLEEQSNRIRRDLKK
jgi:hypothetical protein